MMKMWAIQAEFESTYEEKVDGMGNPEQGRDGPRGAADCAYLAAVPALPGRGDPGV